MIRMIVPETKIIDGYVYQWNDFRTEFFKHLNKRFFYAFISGDGFKIKVMDKNGYFDHEVSVYPTNKDLNYDMLKSFLLFHSFDKHIWATKN